MENENKDLSREVGINLGIAPPNAVDMEIIILGMLLISERGADDIYFIMGDDSNVFYDPRHQIIYKKCMELRAKQKPVNLQTVIWELKSEDKLTEGGGDHYIIDLTMGVSSVAHAEYYCFIVLEKYMSRRMISECQTALSMLIKGTDVLKTVEDMRGMVEQMEITIASRKPPKTSNDEHRELIERIKEGKPKGIPTGYKSIDMQSGGFFIGSLVVIGGRPGMGKTTVAINFATSTAKLGTPVAFFSLEMYTGDIHERHVANDLDISYGKLSKYRLNDAEMQKLFMSAKIENLPLYYETENNFTKICSRIRILAKKYGVKVVYIDYLQIIECDIKGMNREQTISYMTRTFKRLGLELGIIIVLMSQLGRSVEARPIKRPFISDLRESGAIEQDADVIMLLYRPEYYKVTIWDRDWDDIPNLPTNGQIEIAVGKFRNGSVFEQRFQFWGDKQRILEMDAIVNFSNPLPFASGYEDNNMANPDDDDLFKPF